MAYPKPHDSTRTVLISPSTSVLSTGPSSSPAPSSSLACTQSIISISVYHSFLVKLKGDFSHKSIRDLKYAKRRESELALFSFHL
jgi:hypothetical protein